MSITRREFIQRTSQASLALAAAPLSAADISAKIRGIDRPALVRRHNPVVTRADPFSALSVGNGELAFTVDPTGLQTFLPEYEKEFPLCTTAHWAWHSFPLPAGLRRADFKYKEFNTHGRPVSYATEAKGQEALFKWLRENPHGLHLGRLGLSWKPVDGSREKPADLSDARQTLDLWAGLIDSRFTLEGQPVRVQTCVHPDLDLVAVRLESPRLEAGLLEVVLEFAYGSPDVKMADWRQPDRHQTECRRLGAQQAELARTVDAGKYFVTLVWTAPGKLLEHGPHRFILAAPGNRVLEFVCLFAVKPHAGSLPTVAQTQAAAAGHWQRFWTEGGAIDLSGSTDPRSAELERRIVLSQYQTALHCAGSLPSAETGLLFNSWHGKFHLEMHWWHSVHFTAWNRFTQFERTLGFYERILPVARETAGRQGYRGARWPKMVGPDGHDAPSPVGPLLIWQQPHPIYYAELCYRREPSRSTLERWREVVFATAEFMASFAFLDLQRSQYVLGPPLKTVSENADTLTTLNPAFELNYWRFGLRTAQAWRERLGLPREPQWDAVCHGLAPLPMQGGRYLLQEGMTDTFTRWNWEHPALMGIYGMQPGPDIDTAAMRRTVQRVMEVWQWDRAWGWDFPMAAMAAARVGEPALAVKALLIDSVKNRYLPNGHNYQRPNLTAYLPGNGGLLAATAMMAAGWTGSPSSPAPGFPTDGQWSVRCEGLRQWL
jgi:protein-glucosylgalactosylhydroxylysine glucosidase